MGMNVGGHKGGVNAEINMTPLIDIVLVLLIIFMVMTPMMLKELNANLPPSTPPPPDMNPQPVTDQQVVEVRGGGEVLLNGTVVTEAGLADKLREALGPKAENKRVVFFKLDDDAPYGRVVLTMDIARGAGAKTLGIAAPK